MRQSLLIAILIFVFSGFSVWGEGSRTRDQHISCCFLRSMIVFAAARGPSLYLDHPSHTLTLSHVSVVNMPEKMMRIVSDLRLGVMGPASLGFRTQELAHSVSNPSRPTLGWEYQLQNDFIINYDIRLEKGVFSIDLACIGFMGKGRLGTLHTGLEAGLWFILNKSSPYVIPSDKVMPWIGNLDASLSSELLAHQLEFYTRLASPRFHMAVPHGWMAIACKFCF